jgi:D-sedoheptulose 7-phosphate isomerase
MQGRFVARYMRTLHNVVASCAVTDGRAASLELDVAVREAGRQMKAAHHGGNRLFFIGNGGSAAIASHMAADYSKNGRMRSSALTDASVITCLANDYGYEHIFEKQIEWQVRAGDILVAISSSGRSENILNGVRAARAYDCKVFTLTGFNADNPLRQMGDLNFYLASGEYGFVEIGHLALLHGVLDMEMGLRLGGVSSAA